MYILVYAQHIHTHLYASDCRIMAFCAKSRRYIKHLQIQYLLATCICLIFDEKIRLILLSMKQFQHMVPTLDMRFNYEFFAPF